MATVIKSNQAYTGSRALPNLIDFVTTTADKVTYLKQKLSIVNGDANYITTSTADSIFTKLMAHRDRVIADGGIVPSLPMTIRAIVFASKNNLSAADYDAVSPEFGVKISGNNVIKVYSLTAIDKESYTGALTRTTNSGLQVLTCSETGGVIAKTPRRITGGLITGMCAWDVNADSKSYIRGSKLHDNPKGTSNEYAYLETNYGRSWTFVSRSAPYVTDSAAKSSVGDAYEKYAGVVGFRTPTANLFLIKNGVVEHTRQYVFEDWSEIDLYDAIYTNSANSFINEQWLIKSASQELAIALSNHLNKSELATS